MRPGLSRHSSKERHWNGYSRACFKVYSLAMLHYKSLFAILISETKIISGTHMKQIIAIGGGGFGHYASTLLNQYILKQAGKPSPKICFLPQASAESKDYIVNFYETFSRLGAQPSWISLFGRVEPSWEEHLLSQDIIYVGGGNTRSMLALWREWGIDAVLREAYERGIILSGTSAGAICWFEQGITDSGPALVALAK